MCSQLYIVLLSLLPLTIWGRACLLILILLAGTITANAKGPKYETSGDVVAVDRPGNVYVAGQCTDSTKFGDTLLAGSQSFIAKYGPDGKLLWVRGDRWNMAILKMNTDSQNNLYVARGDKLSRKRLAISKYNSLGNLVWTVDPFKGGRVLGNVINIENNGNVWIVWISGRFSDDSKELQIAKLDSSGHMVFRKSATLKGGKYSNSSVSSQAIVNSDNYVLKGYLEDTLIFGNTTLMQKGSGDSFIVKCDTTGEPVWAIQNGKFGIRRGGGSLTVDGFGNIFATDMCYYWGPKELCKNTILSKYNADGQKLWEKEFGELIMRDRLVGADSQGNCYLTGSFMKSVQFDDTLLKVGPPRGIDLFITKFNTNGNVQWANHINSNSNDEYGNRILDMYVDEAGNIYITGFSSGETRFGSKVLKGDHTGFIAKYNTIGQLIWINQFVVKRPKY